MTTRTWRITGLSPANTVVIHTDGLEVDTMESPSAWHEWGHLDDDELHILQRGLRAEERGQAVGVEARGVLLAGITF